MVYKKKYRLISFITVIVLGLGVFSVCDIKSIAAKKEVITSIEQLNAPDVKIGVSDNTNDNEIVAEKMPQAQVKYYKDAITGYTEVSQGKLDAFVYGKIAMEEVIRNGQQGVRLLDETLGESYTMAAAVSPNTQISDLENQINTFLDEAKADGILDDMQERWLIEREDTMPDISLPESSDIHLVVGTSGVYAPYTYFVGDEVRGYDIELAYRFAAWLGATIEFKIYDYDGIIPAALTGDVDCIFSASTSG